MRELVPSIPVQNLRSILLLNVTSISFTNFIWMSSLIVTTSAFVKKLNSKMKQRGTTFSDMDANGGGQIKEQDIPLTIEN